jgi:predicted O-methyltransferase YrrM
MNDDNFLESDSWFDEMFREKSSRRFSTFRVALNLLYQQPNHRIVETGTTRMVDDYGAGYSTYIFGQFVKRYGGHIITIDIEPRNMDVCRMITDEFHDQITYVIDDSLRSLPLITEKIDLLYLDSLDLPLEGDASEAQTHNLKEFKLVEHLLHEKSIVLIDDNDFNGGKPLLTKKYLKERGWRVLLNEQQSLWIR